MNKSENMKSFHRKKTPSCTNKGYRRCGRAGKATAPERRADVREEEEENAVRKEEENFRILKEAKAGGHP